MAGSAQQHRWTSNRSLGELVQNLRRHSVLPADETDGRGHTAAWSGIVDALKHIHTVLPGFLNGNAYKSKRTLTPTSYLVALRGFAAVIVINTHMSLQEDLDILYQPFVGIIVAGNAMVDVFFVISGFVLSYKLVQLARAQDAGKLIRTLAGSIFRRWMRLYIPCLMAMFVMMLFISTSIAENPWVKTKDTFWAQLWDFIKDASTYSNPFQDVPGYWTGMTFTSRYLFQLWTIPAEFRGSLVVFIMCAGTCMLTKRSRLLILCGLVLLAFSNRVVFVALFVSGTVLAELSLARQEKAQRGEIQQYQQVPSEALCEPGSSVDGESDSVELDDLEKGERDETQHALSSRSARRWLSTIAFTTSICLALVISILLLSGPVTVQTKTPKIFKQLASSIPPWWGDGDWGGNEQFWFGIGAVLFIAAFDFCPALQVPLRWNVSQYLGDLSFGIYAVHPLFLYSVDARLAIWMHKTQDGALWCLIPRIIAMYFCVFWAADYFARADRMVVNLGYWLQKRYFVKWPGEY